MKPWAWSIIVFITTFIIMIVLDIPFWLFLLVIIPLLIIGFTIFSFAYSFRKSLKAEHIPKHGYEKQIQELDRDSQALTNIGFDKCDSFFLRMIPNAIVYVLKHRHDPAYLCLYHFSTKKTCDIFTRYENDYTLTTCDNIDGGMSPRPRKSLLQIITKVSFRELAGIHKRAHDFLLTKNMKPLLLDEQEFRYYFLEKIHEYADHIKRYPFWPILLIYWTVTRRGRIFCREIENQYQHGSIDLSGT